MLTCAHVGTVAGDRLHIEFEHRIIDGRDRIGMTIQQTIEAPEQAPDHAQKQAALGYLQEAWVEARIEGIDGDCLAQACLFAAFAEFVTTYGEEAAARFAEGLARRIRNGEFSLPPPRQ